MMKKVREHNSEQKNTTSFVLILLFASLFPVALYAAGVILSAPTSAPKTSDFAMRQLDVTGSTPVAHRGTDYGVSCGTQLSPGGTVNCTTMSGYGGVGEISRGCGVVERFAHLQRCDSNSGTMTTGGKSGMPGAGTSTGCHLHYEIRINGTAVNPLSAYGKDLCDENVRKQLISEAQSIMNGQAGGGGGSTASASNSTPPSSTPNGSSVTYVAPGEEDPTTHVINTGAGYYNVTEPDGRTYKQVDVGDDDLTVSILPPTTSDVVPSGGAGGEVTGCATDTWRAMVNQAVLQTRREMVMNERYIAKPDSILAYSCFKDAINNARTTLGVFSESKYWVNKQVDVLNGDFVTINRELGEYSLDGAMTNAALEPFEAFLRMFNYDVLGGMPTSGAAYTPIDVEEGPVPAGFTCGTMARVWQLAKCMNITDEPAFYTFSDLINNDPRKYPPTYACHDTGITQGMIDIARNKSTQFSNVTTYLNLLDPSISGGTCAAPIQTGITISRQEGSDRISEEKNHEDALCLTAGCSYQNSGGGGVGTCQVKGP